MTKPIWKAANVYINNAPNRAFVIVNAWPGATIADCGEATPENMANAQRMAASNELMRALTFALQNIEEIAIPLADAAGRVTSLNRAAEVAREALALAKGHQP